MGLLSILPEDYAFVETWLKRLFFLMGLLMIGPWAFLLIYDFLLYVARAINHEIPFVGGRARGKARPRAPSLTERPGGHRRRFSLARRPQPAAQSGADLKLNASDPRWREIQEETDDYTTEDTSAFE
ncbi:hypothetical protein BU26DRAFT_440582 [Trematosphaeria pertusa]|uniref:Uncharacterized protein n=1 Tax=Trematosphaeria pertusa TaxID=390896 RepID=A0A6A6HV10_9PLEO|nr:uncharacterized protein BU26DRAFT_440582 [Trematosphaeria pertusa]KAF2241592.1 hypothetical protein BU26DRAFT_440582 [Trematosphaeria pertusa]